MAASPAAAAPRSMPSWLFITLLQSLFQSPVAAVSNPTANPTQHAPTSLERQNRSLPLHGILHAVRHQCGWAPRGQLMSWNMAQSISLCGLLLLLTAWWKSRATTGRPANADSQKRDKQAGAAAATYEASLTDAQVTDPGLLKKHSTHRLYTTSFGVYPAIRVFSREHPQTDKLPSKPTPLPLLFFIHGLGGSLLQFHFVLTSLVNVAPCLGIDLPGCGLSGFAPTTWSAYTQEALVELLATVIADSCQRNTGQGVVLIAHSMGCSLAALLASAHSPLKAKNIDVLGLVAICPKAVPPTDHQLTLYRRLLWLPTPVFDLWRRWDRRGGPESASIARFVGAGADAETKRLQERFNTQSKSAVWRRMAWGLFSGQFTGLDVWARLSLPIFLIAGESDTTTSPDEVVAIGSALGKLDQSSLMSSTVPVRLPEHHPMNEQDEAGTTNSTIISSNSHSQSELGSTTGTTALADQSLSSDPIPNGTDSSRKRQPVLKTCIFPAPATHSLLYDPTTYRTLAGLIQKFLWDHVDHRLSLGWQLQHLSTEGKWDVKNLVKWQAVVPVSEPIAGVFRAMKTLRQIDEAHSPEIFVRNWKGKVRAVVDISYENPVYDPRGLEDGGIEYHKFPTVSKIPPTTDEVQGFIKLIDRIRQTASAAANDATIGVHCHYGFNRTGFFICSYLIEREHYSVQEAMDEFQKQRPPGIRHDHFQDTLFVRYCVGLKRAPTM